MSVSAVAVCRVHAFKSAPGASESSDVCPVPGTGCVSPAVFVFVVLSSRCLDMNVISVIELM